MKKILILLSVSLVFFSCSKDDKVTGRTATAKADSPVFYAATEGTANPGTKVYADENLLVLWNADDKISIFNRTTLNSEFVFVGEDGDNAGAFEEIPYSGFITGNDIDHIVAVYPYSKSNKVDNLGMKVTVNIPDVQEYREKSFGVGANTMVAITNTNFLAFKNVCGYVRFRFYGDDVNVRSVTLEGNNGEKIAGKALVTLKLGGTPTSEMDGSATDKITINCTEPVTIGSSSSDFTEFIFAIPPTTFSKGFKVRVINENGSIFEKSSTRSLTVSRNRMESMGAMKVELTPTAFVEFEDANFKAYCVDNFDSDGDSEISYEEALEITRVDLCTSNPDIYSLEGIEYFENLTYLRCRGNDSNIGKLTALDLRMNNKLDSLDCSFNQIAQLQIAEDNSNLTYLDCSFNQLTDIDLGTQRHLKDFRCYNNSFQTLDVRNCFTLDILYAWPQNGTFSMLLKRVRNIVFKNSDGTTISPYDYGTDIFIDDLPPIDPGDEHEW